MSKEEQVNEAMEFARAIDASVLLLNFVRETDGKEFTAFALATMASSEDGEAVPLDRTEGTGMHLKTFTVVTD